MREAFIILLVIFILAALTAVKYRKQIAGMIGFAKILKDVTADITQDHSRLQRKSEASISLVNCSKCGVWVPQNKATKSGEVFVCSNH